jgi:ABC-type transporter Mla MlaB component
MLRIAQVDKPNDSIRTLKLEGKLLGPWVDELRRVCEELRVPPSELCLNLSAVTFVDAAGFSLLVDLVRRGTTISECTGFVKELLSDGGS